MNHLVEENVQSITFSSKNVISKKKILKAKDSSDSSSDQNKVNEEELSESLSNALHVSGVNGSLSNGGGAHSPPARACRQRETTPAVAAPVHNSHCDNGNYGSEDSCSNQMLIVRNLVEVALENLETALCLEDKPQKDVEIISYESELQMAEIMRLIQKDLSEPYSIYTYRYFIHNWPKLCFLAMYEGKCIGAIVCKLDMHRNVVKRGYIAMLAVDETHRKKRIGSSLVQRAIQAMSNDNADEVVLETEITNKPALKLYENLGFVRDKRLFRYYLNGVDALRLKLWLR